jgi:hypothetical protein
MGKLSCTFLKNNLFLFVNEHHFYLFILLKKKESNILNQTFSLKMLTAGTLGTN